MLKNKKGEEYLLLIISIFALVLGPMILTGRLEIKEDDVILGDSIVFAVILIILGSCALIISIHSILRKIRIKKYSIYYILKDTDDETIKNELTSLGLKYDDIIIDRSDYYISIEYKKSTGYFYCTIDDTIIGLGYEYSEEYYEKYSEEEIEQMPLFDLDEEISALHMPLDDLAKLFVKLILENEYKINC